MGAAHAHLAKSGCPGTIRAQEEDIYEGQGDGIWFRLRPTPRIGAKKEVLRSVVEDKSDVNETSGYRLVLDDFHDSIGGRRLPGFRSSQGGL